MPEKKSVTVPLTARQKEQIKKMTGQTINALKVESAGGATLAKKANMLAGRGLTRKVVARNLSRRIQPRVVGKSLTARALGRSVVAKTII